MSINRGSWVSTAKGLFVVSTFVLRKFLLPLLREFKVLEHLKLLSKGTLKVLLNGLMLLCMVLQLLRYFPRRKDQQSFLARLGLLAFNTEYVLAIYTMQAFLEAHELKLRHVDDVWLALLLFNLGGSDGSSTYFSCEDDDLWWERAVSLLIQVGSVFKVIYESVCCSWDCHCLSVVVLGLAGTYRCTERVLALRKSAAAHLNNLALRQQMVMELEGRVSKPAHSHSPRYNFFVQGEQEAFHDLLGKQPSCFCGGEVSVKVQHLTRVVLLSEMLQQQYAPLLKQETRNGLNVVDTCAAFALFKMLRGRLTNLQMLDEEHQKIQMFFTVELSQRVDGTDRIIRLLDAELRFVVDSIQNKSYGTDCSWIMVILQGLSFLIILVASAVISTLAGKGNGGLITCVSFACGIVIQVWQLVRLIRSDWTIVWLACMYVTGIRESNRLHKKLSGHLEKSNFNSFDDVLKRLIGVCTFKAWNLLAAMSLCTLSSTLYCTKAETGYRTNEMGQVSQISGSKKPLRLYGEKVRLVEAFLIEKVLQRCSLCNPGMQHEAMKHSMAQVTGYSLSHHSHSRLFRWASATDLVNALATWEIATSVCEIEMMVPPGKRDSTWCLFRRIMFGFMAPTDEKTVTFSWAENMEMARHISRYVLYLLVEKADILSHSARDKYARSVTELQAILLGSRDPLKRLLTGCKAKRYINDVTHRYSADLDGLRLEPWHAGRVLAHLLIKHLDRQQRWALLADIWTDFLITIAVSQRPEQRLQLFLQDGEFISHISLLLGHMGFWTESIRH